MHLNSLPSNTKDLLLKISQINPFPSFYLSGGTALALHINHRQSEDLDFFTQKKFKPDSFLPAIKSLGSINKLQLDSGTLNCFINQVQLQLLHYPYKLLSKPTKLNQVNISSKLDIACTKLITISSRGSKKDFIDLYFLLQEYSLPFLFKKLNQKYSKTQFDQAHILKSLVYFKDADEQPPVKSLKDISWPQITKQLITQVKNFKI